VKTLQPRGLTHSIQIHAEMELPGLQGGYDKRFVNGDKGMKAIAVATFVAIRQKHEHP